MEGGKCTLAVQWVNDLLLRKEKKTKKSESSKVLTLKIKNKYVPLDSIAWKRRNGGKEA